VIKGNRVVVVMPAYNAEKTLEMVYKEIPTDIVDDIILVDDCSTDNTAQVGNKLGLHVMVHDKNTGYGGNQKTSYDEALRRGADIVIMLHPDYQYTPRLILPMASLLADRVFDVVIGSRILGGGALRGGMPTYKYFANRILTLLQNLLTGKKLSEYHSGYRAYRSEVLRVIDYRSNSDDFIFDNQLLCQILSRGFSVGEITCPTRYDEHSSSINFTRSVVYGIGVIKLSLIYGLHRLGIFRSTLSGGSRGGRRS